MYALRFHYKSLRVSAEFIHRCRATGILRVSASICGKIYLPPFNTKFRCLISIIACICSSAVYAQQDENWENYMALLEKKPASVLVNLALYDKSPNRSLPYLLITGPKSRHCETNGIPSKEEIPVLEEMLHETDLFISGVTPKILAGTLTYNCQRVNYYYVKDTAGLGVAMARLYKRSYKDYEYVCKIKPDPDWSSYRNFLYPTEENFTWIENNKIITDLITKGDSLTKPRDIHFILLFKTEQDRKAFISIVHKDGYKVDELSFIKKADVPYCIKISRFEKIEPDMIAEMTTEVKAAAKNNKGLYEGWSCDVTK